MSQNLKDSIPRDVVSAFFSSDIESAELLSGGLINTTYAVYLENGGDFVLQQLSDAVDSVLYENFRVVDEYLANKGWEMPGLLPINDGDGVVYEGSTGVRWVGFKKLTNDKWQIDPAQIGALLGKLHKDLRELDYEPLGDPLIIDSEERVKQLENVKDQISEEAKALAEEMLAAYESCKELPSAQTQLIHADCKVENMLYRDGRPYTFVGWKTLMKGNVWLDIGDMMRSLAKYHIEDTGEVNLVELEKFITAYHQENDLNLSLEDFRKKAIHATKHIALVLAIRYLEDHREEGYFNWDSENYTSRHEHNLERAKIRYEIYKSLC